MKYARIDIETIGFVNKEDKAHINYGDHLQNIVIKDLYKKMGIPEEEIYVLNFNEISTYDGEYLVLPINQAISHNLASFISPKIIPVFLGISRDVTAINTDEIEYLKQFAPIGCRDQAVFDFLVKKHVPCYLNGCISATLERRASCPEDGKVLVIEAPQYAIDSMPESLKKDVEYRENTCYGAYNDLIYPENSIEKVVRNQYQYLKDHAKLVVTSRMHIASPCVGMGIPVILVRNSVDYRFSWIDKYIPVYTEESKDSIDWNPSPVDLEGIKEHILNYSMNRIKSIYENNIERLAISEHYEQRTKVKYSLPHFSDNVIDFVENKWSKDEKWNYAIWGENDASERLYNYLSSNYPNAIFTAFYDSYKKVNYHGIDAQHPNKIDPQDHVFVFVTGYTATDAANELFHKIGLPEDSYYLFGSVVRDYK